MVGAARPVARVAMVAIALAAELASAQPSAATQAFERGRELLQQGKYREACEAFEASQQRAPQLETQFNLALCSEQIGKLATALALHRELAVHETTASQRARSAELAAQLEARVPRLRLAVTERGRKADERVPRSLIVTVNGVRVTNFQRMPIELGNNHVVATAPGFRSWSGQVTAPAEGATVPLTITLEREPGRKAAARYEPAPAEQPAPLPAAAAPAPADTDAAAEAAAEPPAIEPAPASSPGARPSSSDRRTFAVITVIGGGIVLAGGLTAGVLAQRAWSDAKAECGGMTRCGSPADLERANSLVDDAQLRGDISTALVIAGGALVAGGLVLWATAPSEERSIALSPTVDPSSAGLTLVGRF